MSWRHCEFSPDLASTLQGWLGYICIYKITFKQSLEIRITILSFALALCWDAQVTCKISTQGVDTMRPPEEHIFCASVYFRPRLFKHATKVGRRRLSRVAAQALLWQPALKCCSQRATTTVRTSLAMRTAALLTIMASL